MRMGGEEGVEVRDVEGWGGWVRRGEEVREGDGGVRGVWKTRANVANHFESSKWRGEGWRGDFLKWG